jgi:hypothetical protein
VLRSPSCLKLTVSTMPLLVPFLERNHQNEMRNDDVDDYKALFKINKSFESKCKCFIYMPHVL